MADELSGRGILTGKKRLIVLIAAVAGMMTGIMNGGIASMAMPKVIADLGGISSFNWAFTAFMLTSTTSIPLAGKLADIYGRRPVVVTSLSILALGAILCGLAGSMEQLIAFRAFQGLGAGPIIGMAFVIIADFSNTAERARWQGNASSGGATAMIAGPLLGGLVTDQLGWRWAFFITPPLALACIAILLLNMPEVRQAREKRMVDYPGAVCLVLTVIPLLLALTWAGNRYDWLSAQIAGLLSFSFVMVGVFSYVEKRAQDPILPLNLLGNNAYKMGSVLFFSQGAASAGTMIYIPLFIQGVLGASATESALLMVPQVIAITVSTTILGQIASRWDRYDILIIFTFLPWLAGMLLLSNLSADTPRTHILLIAVPLGAGIGMVRPLARLIVQSRVSRATMGIATSSLEFFASVGTTLGLAVAGTVFNSQIQGQLNAYLRPEVRDSVTPEMLEDLADPRLLLNKGLLSDLHNEFLALGSDGQRLFDSAFQAARESLASSIAAVFVMSLFAVLIAIGLSLLTPIVLRRGVAAPAPEPVHTTRTLAADEEAAT